jgi:hypothetical protein
MIIPDNSNKFLSRPNSDERNAVVEEFYTKVPNLYPKRYKKALLFPMRQVSDQQKRGSPGLTLEGMKGKGKTFPK